MEELDQILNSVAKFICHQCNQEVPIKREISQRGVRFLCQLCNSEFVEEVTPRPRYDERLLSVIERRRLQILELSRIYPLNPSVEDRQHQNLDYVQQLGLTSPSFPQGFDSFISDLYGHETDLTDDHSDEGIVDSVTSQLLDEVMISGPPPLSKEEIKLLTTVHVNKETIEKDLQCTVCMEDFRLRQKIKQLPCRHLYHNKCISTWLQKQASCPNCREVVSSPKPQNSRSRSNSPGSGSDDELQLPGRSSFSDFFTTSINPFRLLL